MSTAVGAVGRVDRGDPSLPSRSTAVSTIHATLLPLCPQCGWLRRSTSAVWAPAAHEYADLTQMGTNAIASIRARGHDTVGWLESSHPKNLGSYDER